MEREKENEHAVQYERDGQTAEVSWSLWQRELWRDR